MPAPWRRAAEVDTEHHLIITHEVTNIGTDRSQLAHVAKETKATLEATSLDVIADRGYFSSEEILAREEAGITVTLPKPMTSNSKAEGRFGKQDFRYAPRRPLCRGPAVTGRARSIQAPAQRRPARGDRRDYPRAHE